MKKEKLLCGSLFNNTLFLVANGAMNSILGIVAMLIVTRYFPEAEVGLGFTMISMISLIGFVAGFGFNIGIIHFLPKVRNRSGLINSCLLISTAGATAFGIASLLIIWLMNMEVKQMLDSITSCVFFILFIIFFTTGSLMNNVFVSQRNSKYVFYKDSIIFGVGRLALLLLLIYLSFDGSKSIFLSWGFGIAIAFLLAYALLLRRVEQNYSFTSVMRPRKMRNLARYSFANYLAGIFGLMPAMFLPILITEAISPEATAYFVIPWTIINVIFMAINALNTALFAEGSCEPGHIKSSFKQALLMTLGLAIIATVALYFLSGTALSLFGSSYEPNADQILKVLAFSIIPVGISSLYVTSERVRGRTSQLIIFYLITGPGTVILSFIMLGPLGLVGASAAWTITQTAVALMALYRMFGRFN